MPCIVHDFSYGLRCTNCGITAREFHMPMKQEIQNMPMLEEFNRYGENTEVAELGANPPRKPTFEEIQAEIGEWASRNFGPNHSKEMRSCHYGHPLGELPSFLGMVEELGELSAVLVKSVQGRFKGTAGEADLMVKDALADFLVFACDFCTRRDIDLIAELRKTWAKVQKRSQKTWLKDKAAEDGPKSGNDGPGHKIETPSETITRLTSGASPLPKCPECFQPISDETPSQCPNCGYQFKSDTREALSDGAGI